MNAPPQTDFKRRRSAAGIYTIGPWTLTPMEGEDRAPGYHWCSHNPDEGAGEHYHATLAAATDFVLRRLGVRT